MTTPEPPATPAIVPHGFVDVVARLRAVAAADPDRPAVLAADAALTYADLAVVADREQGRGGSAPPEPFVADNTAAAVAELVARMARRQPTLVLDPASTDSERRASLELFDAHFAAPPGGPGAGQPLFALTTSGTTGRPKVVLQSWWAYGGNCAALVDVLGFAGDDTLLVTTPLHHGYALTAGLLPGLLAGATVALPALPLTPGAVAYWLARERPTVLQAVPYLYRLLLDTAPDGLGGLRTAISAGAPLPSDVAASWQARVGAPLHELYGITELGVVSVTAGPADGSVGRPLPGIDVAVVDPEESRGTSPDSGSRGTSPDSGSRGTSPDTAFAPRPHGVGHLVIRSPWTLETYAGDPDASRAAYRGGWFLTRDLAEVTDAGDIMLKGRLTERINVGGNKVDPLEVEEAICSFPAVAEAAVVGRSGRGGDEEVWAYVVTDGELPRTQLVAHLRDRLTPYKIPVEFVAVDALPRTALGKLRRGLLAR